ncbi:MAG: N-6 DNA methylase [Lutibacter sp.]|nr:N-6 DNA methylase [Lutibacter sp.]
MDNLIHNFSIKSVADFFKSKISSFSPNSENFNYILTDKDFTNFTDLKKTGEVEFKNSDELIIFTCKFQGVLSERSSKKKQFEIAKKVLKEDFKDGAIFIFYDNNGCFRFSFIRKNYGNKDQKFSNWKRYTYFVEPSRTNKTFKNRINGCNFSSLEDIQEAFSVEKLNKKFYEEIATAFYSLIGGKVSINKKEVSFDSCLQLPSTPKENRKVYQEFAVRLIGRTIFCWFLKNKKSDSGLPLIPEEWLSSKMVAEVNNQQHNYYHSIIEKLFFLILNKKQKDRKPYDLPNGQESVPFLNGGLFEAQVDDFFPKNHKGIHSQNFALNIPNTWFKDFFEVLEQYNFTIDENSINDFEVSIDPEMLGTIFENLLAEIDPDTEKSARKSTGSFYTPREIVDYMVEQSLLQYIKTKTKIEDEEQLEILLKDDTENPFDEKQTIAILEALSDVKILDPACGSGAFPMGVLHKIIGLLKKLDKNAVWWKAKQLEKIDNALVKKAMEAKLNQANSDYIRKLGVIQHSIYGIDIQPIAAEISKLRSFLSLIIDENIDDKAENRGIEPLPNLEFKFVTANTLIGLEAEKQQTSFDFGETEELQEQLQKIRNTYLQASPNDKQKLKTDFEKLQTLIYKNEIKSGGQNKRAQQLSAWKPFSNESSTWFDPDWMFGVEKFDVIIGNPPYVYTRDVNFGLDFKKYVNDNYFLKLSTPKDKIKSKSTQSGKINLFALFILNGKNMITPNGSLNFIIPNNLLRGTVFDTIRYDILKNNNIYSIVDLGAGIFDKVTASTILFQIGNNIENFETKIVTDVKSLSDKIYNLKNINRDDFLKNTSYTFNIMLDEKQLSLSNKIKENKVDFGNYCVDIIEGIVAHKHLIFPQKKNNTFELLEGKDIKRFKINDASNHIIWNLNEIHRKRPDYLWEEPKKIVMQRISGGTMPLVAAIDQKKRKSFASTNNIVLKNEYKDCYEFFTGLLNSKLINWFYANNFSNNSSLTVNISKTFLETLPISFPIKHQIHLFDKVILDLEGTFGTDVYDDLNSKLNVMVYKLYELDYEEVLVVEPTFRLSKKEYEVFTV